MDYLKSILLFILLLLTVSVYPQDQPDYHKYAYPDKKCRYVLIDKTACISDSLTLYEGEVYKKEGVVHGDSVRIRVNNSVVYVSQRLIRKYCNLPDSFEIQQMITQRDDTLYIENKNSKVLYIVWGKKQQLDSIKSSRSFTVQYPFRVFYKETEPHFIEQGNLDIKMRPDVPVISKEAPSSGRSNGVIYYVLVTIFILIVLFILLRREVRLKSYELKIEITKYRQSRKEMFDCTVYERDGFVWAPENIMQNALPIQIKGEGQYEKFKATSVITLRYRYYTLQIAADETITREDNPSPFEFVFSRNGTPLHVPCRSGNGTFEDKVIFSDKTSACTYKLIVSQQRPGCNVDFTKRHIVEVVVMTSTGAREEYNYEIFKPSGHVWVGIDPGTTGSTMAIGTNSDNIHLMAHVDSTNRKYNIINSVVLFDKSEILGDLSVQDMQPYVHYRFGLDAHNDNAGIYTKFRSIKKWLGYKNDLKVCFDNGYRLFKGVEVAGLLIKGLYHVLETYVERCGTDANVYRDNNGTFNPDKAVVAVPNNYTIKKIQEMITAVRASGKFSTVLYVYEAEAVLFYYLRLPGVDPNKSNVLVFDIGGATINASCFHIDVDDMSNYKIDTKGRIGYGIGGDTLDYSIIRVLLSMPEIQKAWGLSHSEKEVVEERVRTFECKHNAELVDLAFVLKSTIVENFSRENRTLIGKQNLSELIGRFASKAQLEKPEIGDSYIMFERSQDGNYSFFNQLPIQTYIYDNVKDAVSELCKFADVRDIAQSPVKVIFSGRTTFFPYIRQCVIDALKAKFIQVDEACSFDINQSKTVVAEGCCYYGINMNKIQLINDKSLYTYGALIRRNANQSEFIPLIEAGSKFDNERKRIDSPMKHGGCPWGGDGVQFFQITGYVADTNNPRPILSMPKHKYSKFATIDATFADVNYELQMSLHVDDTIHCSICPTGGQKTEQKGNVISKDIVDENDPHYYFGTIYHSLNR